MIGVARGSRTPWRGAVLGIAAALLLGAVLAARPAEASLADPTLEAARQRELGSRAATAVDFLSALQERLLPAREAARDGSARIVDGDERPTGALLDAAARLEGAADAARDAALAMDRLRGTAASVRPELVVPLTPSPVELMEIAAQLRDAADAAGPFVERRWASERVLERLAAALEALEGDDPQSALGALAAARRSREALAAWDPAPVTLPLWLETTDHLIGAARDIARATLAGDAVAARRAGRAYAAAAEDAHRADVSLGLSLAETGSGLTATPLRRLATALAAIEVARGQVASVSPDG
jgi:hypothetical protein